MMLNASNNELIVKLKEFFKFYYYYFKYLKFIQFSVSSKVKSFDESILLVSHDMSKTGAPMLLLHIVKELHKLGWNITVVTMSPGPLIEECSRYSRVLVCRKPKYFIKNLNKLRLLNVKKAFVNTSISGNWSGCLKAQGFTVVSLVHELPGAILAWGATSSASEIALESDVVVFPSRFVKDKFENLVKIKTKYRILPQGLFLKSKSMPNRETAISAVRQKYGFDEKTIVLNVASGNYRKGFDLFVDLAKKEPNLNFVWVGDIDKDIYEDVSSRLNFCTLTNLHLLGYVSDVESLMSLYSASCVLALTSREEPFGSVVLEAMNAGTPVVGFRDVGGFQDIVKCNENGFLVDVEDVDAMLSKIRLISSDKKLAIALGGNAKSIAKHHDFECYIAKLISFFEV